MIGSIHAPRDGANYHTEEAMSAHQRYLEAPYERAAALDAAFEYWCEENDRDFDDEDAFEDFERFIDSFDE